MAWEVKFYPAARRQLASLPEDTQKRLARTINGLCDDPRPTGSRKLRGSGLGLRRVRTGSYRVIYQIYDQIVTVVIVRIGHRRDVYRGL